MAASEYDNLGPERGEWLAHGQGHAPDVRSLDLEVPAPYFEDELSGGRVEKFDDFVTVSWPTKMDGLWVAKSLVHAIPQGPTDGDVSLTVSWRDDYGGYSETQHRGGRAAEAITQCELSPDQIDHLQVDFPTRYVVWSRHSRFAAPLNYIGLAATGPNDVTYLEQLLDQSLPTEFAGAAARLTGSVLDALRI